MSPRSDDDKEEPESDEIVDDTEDDTATASPRYDITSYGIDFDVHGLVRRLNAAKVQIPTFQRSYVWNLREASRFIESILLGLPVPGVFLAKEPRDEALLVIDGQQRLRTLQFFIGGAFNPKPEKTTQRAFKLEKVNERFLGKSYQDLTESDRAAFDDSVIHATVIKQESPQDNDTSIYHVFERLNSGGQKLTPQEIRVAVSHGALVTAIKNLNEDTNWRQLFGPKSPRLKDQEMILRALALAYEQDKYERPMSEFLNKFLLRHRNPSDSFLKKIDRDFAYAAETILGAGSSVVRPERAFNAAVFEAMAVALIRLPANARAEAAQLAKKSLGTLLKKNGFIAATSRSTADEKAVAKRIDLAAKAVSP